MSAVGLPLRQGTARLRRAMGLGAAATASAVLLAFIGSNVFASIGQRNLTERWEAARANPTAHSSPRPGDPVARIRIAGAGIDAVVVEGPGGGRTAPLHIAGTALPGRNGLSAVQAGRLGFGGFFSRLDRLVPGDAIAVQSIDDVTMYRVIDVRRIAAEEIDFSESGDSAILMLIAPASRLGNGERLVVRAKADA